jgi:hypothetical protein
VPVLPAKAGWREVNFAIWSEVSDEIIMISLTFEFELIDLIF